MRDLCSEYGITTKTGYKWKQRFLDEGIEGLQERSRRPHSNSKHIVEEVVCEIIRIKNAYKNWGPRKIRLVYVANHPGEYNPSISSVERILKKSGMIQTRKKRRKHYGERIQNRFKPSAPNQLWTVDFKGWWYTKFGEKCEPLTVRDEFSKFILDIRILEKADISSVKQVFLALFRKYGLPEAIRSDNGPPFASSVALLGLTKLAAWWISLGIRLDRIDPGAPYQNGAHERMHLDMQKELEGKISGDLKLHQKVFDVWRKEFNYERPHEALDMKTPSSVYRVSNIKYKPYNGVEYPEGFTSRKVHDKGTFCLKQRRIFISNALNGFDIGIKDSNEEFRDVYFCEILIGQLDMKTLSFVAKTD